MFFFITVIFFTTAIFILIKQCSRTFAKKAKTYFQPGFHTIQLSKENFEELTTSLMSQAKKSAAKEFKVKVPSQPFDRISDEDKTVKLNIHRGLQFTIKAVSDFGASDCMLRAQMYRPAIFFAFEFAQKMIKAAIANYTDEKTFNVFYLEENLNKLSAIIAEKIADKNVAKQLLKVASELEKISVGTRADSMCFKSYRKEEAENAESLSHQIFGICIDLLKAKLVEAFPSKTVNLLGLNAEVKINEKNEVWFYLFE